MEFDINSIIQFIIASGIGASITNLLIFLLKKFWIEKKMNKSLEKYKNELLLTRDDEIRKNVYISRQLEEFYSPMIGLLKKFGLRVS